MTIAWPCLLNAQMFGVAGLEVHMNDILQHVTYYQEDSSYAFVTDKRGLRLDHYVFSICISAQTVDQTEQQKNKVSRYKFIWFVYLYK